MSLLHHPGLRAAVRRLGLARRAGGMLKPLRRGSMSYGSEYELRFANELLACVAAGDCVWDVGANVGHFTRRLAERAGRQGCIVAIEPFGATFERLRLNTQDLPQVRRIQVALGAEQGEMSVSAAPESPGNNLLRECAGGERVRITTGARLIAEGCPPPNVIKVDVEGLEEDVLWGLRANLADPRLTAILLEVHYGLLAQRGFMRAPDRLISLLRDAGFRTKWLDAGHLKAYRAAALIVRA